MTNLIANCHNNYGMVLHFATDLKCQVGILDETQRRGLDMDVGRLTGSHPGDWGQECSSGMEK